MFARLRMKSLTNIASLLSTSKERILFLVGREEEDAFGQPFDVYEELFASKDYIPTQEEYDLLFEEQKKWEQIEGLWNLDVNVWDLVHSPVFDAIFKVKCKRLHKALVKRFLKKNGLDKIYFK